MSGEAADEFVVRLGTPEELFAVPRFDPWTGTGAREPGVVRLLDAARAARRPRRMRVVLALPRELSAPRWVQLLLGEGLVIAGWVGLWKPIEILVYDRAGARRERRVLLALREATVEVRPDVRPDVPLTRGR